MSTYEAMSDNELIQHGIGKGYKGLGRREGRSKNKHYFNELRKRGLIDKIFVNKKHLTHGDSDMRKDPPKIRGIYKDYTRDELIAVAIENDLLDKSFSEIRRFSESYHAILKENGMLGNVIGVRLIAGGGTYSQMSDADIRKYMEEAGIIGIGRHELNEVDGSLWRELRRRDILDELTTRKHKSPVSGGAWKFRNMDNEEFIQYAKQKGIYNLTIEEARRNHRSFYIHAINRGLHDEIFIYDLEDLTDKRLLEYGFEKGLLDQTKGNLKNNNSEYYNLLLKRGMIKHYSLTNSAIDEIRRRVNLEEFPFLRPIEQMRTELIPSSLSEL